MNKKFLECQATVEISTELDPLKEILSRKCHMSAQDIDCIVNHYARSSENYLSMLYQVFDILRGNLSKGVYKEASANLQSLDKIIEDEIREFISINSVFKAALMKIEYDLINAGISVEREVENDEGKKKVEVSKDNFIKCIDYNYKG